LADNSSIAGDWEYRSYRNTADQPIFGEGTFTFVTPSSTEVQGTLDMGKGYVLDLQGAIRPAAQGCPLTVEIVGTGRTGTPTAGWEYDYYGFLAYQWPSGVNQVPSLVGSVIRAKPHNGGAAGVTASFIAVKQP
jgi:hypothetical protein